MLACFPSCIATNIFAEKIKRKRKIGTNLECRIGDWSYELKPKIGPARPWLAPKKCLEVRNHRNGVEMVRMKPRDPFIGLWMAWVARCTLCGYRVYWRTLTGSTLTFDPKKKKKKKKLEFLALFWGPSQKMKVQLVYKTLWTFRPPFTNYQLKLNVKQLVCGIWT